MNFILGTLGKLNMYLCLFFFFFNLGGTPLKIVLFVFYFLHFFKRMCEFQKIVPISFGRSKGAELPPLKETSKNDRSYLYFFLEFSFY